MSRWRGLLAVGLTLVLSGCWMMPGQGSSRTGNNELEESITPETVGTLTESWTAGGYTPPVASSYGVVVGTGGTIQSYDVGTGAVVWSVPHPLSFLPPYAAETILVDGDLLLVADSGYRNPAPLGATTLTLDAATGLERVQGPNPRVGRVDSARGPFVVGLGSTSRFPDRWVDLRSVDRSTEPWGEFTGMVRLGTAVLNPPVTLGIEHVYVTGEGLVSADPTNGTQGNGVRAIPLRGTTRDCAIGPRPSGAACPTWATPLDGTSSTSAVISDDYGTLYVGTDAGTVYALDAATGEITWSAAVGSPITATPALVRGTLLVPAQDGRLHAFAADGCGSATCESVWSADAGGTVAVQPAAGGGVVFTGTDAGLVRAFDAAGCGEDTCPSLWEADAGGASAGLAVTLGHLFVTTTDDELTAFAPAPA